MVEYEPIETSAATRQRFLELGVTMPTDAALAVRTARFAILSAANTCQVPQGLRCDILPFQREGLGNGETTP